jgi:type I restriction enzyme S subunit
VSARELITEHLDLWTGAVTKKSSSGRGSKGKVELTGVKKLRELIFELASRGALIPKVNDSARTLKLQEFAELVMGQAPPGSECNKNGIGEIFVKTGEFGAIYPEIKEWTTKPLRMARRGDVLICVVGATVGKLNMAINCAIGRSVAAIRPDQTVIPEYLYYCLIPFTLKIRSQSKGSAQGVIGKAVLNNVELRVPPIDEQKLIVQKVDELMALCDRLEQQTSDQLEAHETLVDTLLGALTQSENATELADNWARLAAHFDTLFTTEQSIDKLKQTILQLATAGKLVPFQGAPVPLKNILSFGPRNGFSPKESNHETGCKVLKLGATTKGWLDLSESKNVDIGNSVLPHLWLKKGDILIQRGNAANHVGCNVLLDSDYPNYIYPDLMMKVRVKEEMAIPSFVALYLSAPGARQFMWERMTGTSGTMPKISKKVVEEIPVSLPDIETQKAVVQKVDELTALCDQLKQRLNQASETRCQLAEAVVEGALN